MSGKLYFCYVLGVFDLLLGINWWELKNGKFWSQQRDNKNPLYSHKKLLFKRTKRTFKVQIILGIWLLGAELMQNIPLHLKMSYVELFLIIVFVFIAMLRFKMQMIDYREYVKYFRYTEEKGDWKPFYYIARPKTRWMKQNRILCRKFKTYEVLKKTLIENCKFSGYTEIISYPIDMERFIFCHGEINFCYKKQNEFLNIFCFVKIDLCIKEKEMLEVLNILFNEYLDAHVLYEDKEKIKLIFLICADDEMEWEEDLESNNCAVDQKKNRYRLPAFCCFENENYAKSLPFYLRKKKKEKEPWLYVLPSFSKKRGYSQYLEMRKELFELMGIREQE